MQESVNNDDILYPGAYHLFTCLVRSRFGTLDELEEERRFRTSKRMF